MPRYLLTLELRTDAAITFFPPGMNREEQVRMGGAALKKIGDAIRSFFPGISIQTVNLDLLTVEE